MPSELEGELLLEKDSDPDSDSAMMITQETSHEKDKVDEEIEGCDITREEDEAKAVSSGNGDGDMANLMEEDDEEMSSFIRIRSQGDGIFEQDEDEDDDEEFFDFAIPEVELRSPPSRKRKQDISFIDNDLAELIEVSEHEEEEQGFRIREAAFSINPELFKSRKRERMPLYLLNPDEFVDDPKKQHQIRRAIITYRHHQDKKQQIIKLTDENKKLRDHVQTLKSKIIELSRCGCKKNATANVDVLDVEISTVPPRMYVRGSRPVLAVPYNRGSMSPNSLSKFSSEVLKNEAEAAARIAGLPSGSSNPKNVSNASTPAQASSTDVTKPLINITSSRLANLNSKTLSSSSSNVFIRTVPKPPVSKVFTNGTSSSSLKGLQMSGASRIAITGGGGGINRPGFIPITLATSIKSEPGVSTNVITTAANSNVSTTMTAPIPITATVKSEPVTPATATPVSRIVFAKKGNTSNAVQTASQLFFGTKTTPQVSNNSVSKKPVQPLTASQLAFASRNNKETTPASNPLSSINNRRIPSQSSQVFQTASGQVLKLVQPSPVSRKISNSAQWKPIAPKPASSAGLNSVPVAKQSINEDIEEMWRRFDAGDEDEMAIIAAMAGTSPPQRNRKQTMGGRTTFDGEPGIVSSNAVLKTCGQVIELDKYQDIVFEEAD